MHIPCHAHRSEQCPLHWASCCKARVGRWSADPCLLLKVIFYWNMSTPTHLYLVCLQSWAVMPAKPNVSTVCPLGKVCLLLQHYSSGNCFIPIWEADVSWLLIQFLKKLLEVILWVWKADTLQCLSQGQGIRQYLLKEMFDPEIPLFVLSLILMPISSLI